DAEDALQEIFLKVFDRIGKYRGDAAFSTWLYRMTANHCLDILRRRKILSFIGMDRAPEAFDRSAEGRPGAGLGLSPVVERALAKLPEKQRRCLVMREMEELSYEEIARALGLTLGSVKSNIHRAKAFLRERLEKEGVSPDDV
ncbi:MAG TPA: RNA polymerase sigma factor, partial [bacterium]|nr:RNA polymerase sigma factor [bacterium]